ncbi:MAG: cytochrome B5 [Nitrospirae bacterium]|nr:cytochrome B5 [Nitrospirota bacterium]
MLPANYSRRFVLSCLAPIFIILCLFTSISHATPEYADRTKQGCLICHVQEDGGDLNDKGLEFSASGYVWPPEGGYRILGPIRKSVRFFIGSLHILAAFLWFGTILYVHLILRPAYAGRGLPKGEVVLGMVSMWIVGISGILLTVSRIRSISVLYSSPWGIVLSVKIAFYLIMIMSALYVVLFIGPKLKRGAGNPVDLKVEIFDPATLSACDGKEGRPVYIAYKDKVYDVGGLKLWKNGVHMKHSSGNDLTAFIAKAPHGDEKLEGLKIVGSYDAAMKPPKTFAQKAFYFIAYMNLVIVFCVLLTIAYWRWGL